MDDLFLASREAVLAAMRSVGREAALREMWRGGFDRLCDYLAIACAPTTVGMGILRLSIVRRPVCRTMVLTGERCSGVDIERGTDSPILLGLVPVMATLAPVSCIRNERRNGREPNALSLVFSGGVTLMQEMGELPGNIMADQFNGLTGGVYKDIVGADSFSMNTGDQGRTLAAILFARRIERVVFCHVIDHVARFGATIVAALKQMIDAENRLIDDRINTIANLSGLDCATRHETIEKLRAARRQMPEIIFVALSTWDARDPRRGRDDGGKGILRAREAFGPMQAADEAVLCPDKRLGCEYADRYVREQDPMRNIECACPAMPPVDMIRLIPTWVKELRGRLVA